jgi:hypothetical protein
MFGVEPPVQSSDAGPSRPPGAEWHGILPPAPGLQRLACLRLDALSTADSPRFKALDEEYARTLALSGAPLLPIVVHAQTGRVIDGAHRVRAAQLRRENSIMATLFEGSEEEAFIESVRMNVGQGKPLLLAERRAAARRILQAAPMWSDRRIGAVCGLSGKTIGVLRRESTAEIPQFNQRIGKDGRVRPVANEGSTRVRGVAPKRQAGTPVVESTPEQGGGVTILATTVPILTPDDKATAPNSVIESGEHSAVRRRIEDLARDQALTSSPDGRRMLDWLRSRAVSDTEWATFTEAVPLSRVYVVADIARNCSAAWIELAESLEHRARPQR